MQCPSETQYKLLAHDHEGKAVCWEDGPVIWGERPCLSARTAPPWQYRQRMLQGVKVRRSGPLGQGAVRSLQALSFPGPPERTVARAQIWSGATILPQVGWEALSRSVPWPQPTSLWLPGMAHGTTLTEVVIRTSAPLGQHVVSFVEQAQASSSKVNWTCGPSSKWKTKTLPKFQQGGTNEACCQAQMCRHHTCEGGSAEMAACPRCLKSRRLWLLVSKLRS